MNEWIATDTGRLDIFLTAQGAAISRIKARDMVKAGSVLVNGRIARKAALVLKPGDQVQASDSGEQVTETRLDKADLKLEVLYEDKACIVISKPAGVTVHPGAGLPKEEATILHGIAHLFHERKIPFSSSATLVHRLDKETTGCLLIAKTPEAHKELQKQFESRTVKKIYLAIVAGVPDPLSAVIDASIGRSTSNRTKMSILGTARTREAKTTYRTIASSDDAALLSCELHTGRTHQIRVHLHAIGHPILGDRTYHTPTSDRLSEKYDVHAVALHAWKLAFNSPADFKDHSVAADPPASMLDILGRVQIKADL
jgi:23S rRNA pseudouridine1911/1915/1917 synthase